MSRFIGDISSGDEQPIVHGSLIYFPRDATVRYFSAAGVASNTGESPAEATTLANALSALGSSPGTIVGVGDGSLGGLGLANDQNLIAPLMTFTNTFQMGDNSLAHVFRATGEVRFGLNGHFVATEATGSVRVPVGTHTHSKIEINEITSTGDLMLLGSGSVYLDIPMMDALDFSNSGGMRIMGPGVVSTGGVALTKSVGSGLLRVVNAATTYNADVADDIILVDTTSRDPEVVLPVIQNGDQKRIIDDQNNAATEPVDIIAAPTQTIDGVASITISTDGFDQTIIGIGTNWRLL